MSDITSLRSQLNSAVGGNSPGGASITAAELASMKKSASGGTLALVDLNNLQAEVMGQGESAEKTAKLSALEQLRPLAMATSKAQSDGIWGALSFIDKINPFAYVRWGLGGTKPGG